MAVGRGGRGPLVAGEGNQSVGEEASGVQPSSGCSRPAWWVHGEAAPSINKNQNMLLQISCIIWPI